MLASAERSPFALGSPSWQSQRADRSRARGSGATVSALSGTFDLRPPRNGRAREGQKKFREPVDRKDRRFISSRTATKDLAGELTRSRSEGSYRGRSCRSRHPRLRRAIARRFSAPRAYVSRVSSRERAIDSLVLFRSSVPATGALKSGRCSVPTSGRRQKQIDYCVVISR